MNRQRKMQTKKVKGVTVITRQKSEREERAVMSKRLEALERAQPRA